MCVDIGTKVTKIGEYEMDLYDMIREGAFEPSMPFPTKPSKPHLPHKHSSGEVKAYLAALEIYEDKEKKYKEERAIWSANKHDLESKFKDLALAYCGVEKDNPKRDTLWRIAWDEGHAYGYAEVLSKLEAFAELVT